MFQTQRQIWTIVAAKREEVADLFTLEEAARLMEQGAIRLDWAGYKITEPKLVLTAIGGYQLEEALKASFRLTEHEISHSVVYMLEPGRFRIPRSKGERAHVVAEDFRNSIYPDSAPPRIFVTHTRPETILGVLQPLNTGNKLTAALGYIGQGGTLTTAGMLFVNRSTWAHILVEAARVLGMRHEEFLSSEEQAALDGKVCPEGIIVPARAV